MKEKELKTSSVRIWTLTGNAAGYYAKHSLTMQSFVFCVHKLWINKEQGNLHCLVISKCLECYSKFTWLGPNNLPKHFTAESIGFVDHSSLLITITVHLTQLTFHSKNVSTAKMCQILLIFSPIDNNAHSQPLKSHWLKY